MRGSQCFPIFPSLHGKSAIIAKLESLKPAATTRHKGKSRLNRGFACALFRSCRSYRKAQPAKR